MAIRSTCTVIPAHGFLRQVQLVRVNLVIVGVKPNGGCQMGCMPLV